MKTNQTDHRVTRLKLKAEEIVKRGDDVRAQISHLVTEATQSFHNTRDGLVQLVKAVAEGAAAGAKETLPDQAETVLQPVMNGMADGLAKSAQAVRLTLEESRARGVHFAREDLDNIAKDFRVVGEVFVNIMSDAASRLGGHVSQQMRTVGEHARQTLLDVWPSLESAIAAALHDPVQLGRESLQAGTSAARQAAGVLFSELGKHLQRAGKKLRH